MQRKETHTIMKGGGDGVGEAMLQLFPRGPNKAIRCRLDDGSSYVGATTKSIFSTTPK